MTEFKVGMIASLSIPSFFDNFDMETGKLSNDELKQALTEAFFKLQHLSI